MFFKIDFVVAYDSVDWRFLDLMMESFDFDVRWRKWIMECVSTTSASILVNGSLSGEFPLERRPSQGDPLSHLMFLIVAEGFEHYDV